MTWLYYIPAALVLLCCVFILLAAIVPLRSDPELDVRTRRILRVAAQESVDRQLQHMEPDELRIVLQVCQAWVHRKMPGDNSCSSAELDALEHALYIADAARTYLDLHARRLELADFARRYSLSKNLKGKSASDDNVGNNSPPNSS